MQGPKGGITSEAGFSSPDTGWMTKSGAADCAKERPGLLISLPMGELGAILATGKHDHGEHVMSAGTIRTRLLVFLLMGSACPLLAADLSDLSYDSQRRTT
jgi:hypothetical protein